MIEELLEISKVVKIEDPFPRKLDSDLIWVQVDTYKAPGIIHERLLYREGLVFVQDRLTLMELGVPQDILDRMFRTAISMELNEEARSRDGE